MKAFGQVFATEFNAVDGFERLKFAGRTDLSIVREFFEYHGIPATPANFSLFFDRYVFWLDQILREGHPAVCEGVRKFIGDLKALPAPPVRGLLTGNIRLGAEIKLRHVQLWEEFETGAFADDAEQRATIAAIAVERGSRILQQALRGDEVLVIGDTPLDIGCARAIGAKVLAVGTGGATLEELKAHEPDWLVKNLGEICAAEAVAGSRWRPATARGSPD